VTRSLHSRKVGYENNAEPCEYQISQRAGLSRDWKVGWRDALAPHRQHAGRAARDPEKYRRLHVIVGDANMAEVSTYLKVGTMAIVLSMVEDDFIEKDLSIDGPVAAFRKSRAISRAATHPPEDGRTISAVDHQREFLALAKRYYKERQQPEPWGRT